MYFQSEIKINPTILYFYAYLVSMNLNKKILLLFWCVLNASLVFADSVIIDGIEYSTLNSKEAYVLKGISDFEDSLVRISSYVKIKGKQLTVVKIGRLAFARSKMTYVVIPSTVKSIETGAFSCCRHLSEVLWTDNSQQLEKIGDAAFEMCVKLKKMIIPSSVTEIGKGAFSYCYNLEDITIPCGITKIEPYTFIDCWGLKSLTIPMNIDSVKESAFFECINLQSLTIKNKDIVIAVSAFEKNPIVNFYGSAKGMRSLCGLSFFYDGIYYNILSDSTLSVAGRDIREKEYERAINIPSIIEFCGKQYSVVEICQGAFKFDSKITSVCIDEGVEKIGANAFESSSLVAVTLPNSMKEIGEGAFRGCRISSLFVPDTLNCQKAELFLVKDGVIYMLLNGTEVSVCETEKKIKSLKIYSTVTCGKIYRVTEIKSDVFVRKFDSILVCAPIERITFTGRTGWNSDNSIKSIVLPENIDCNHVGIGFMDDGIRYELINGREVVVAKRYAEFMDERELPVSITCGNTYKVMSIIKKDFVYRIVGDHEVEVEQWKYDNNDTIKKSVIPSSITYCNKVYSVVGIMEGAFVGSPIKSVEIPNSVKIIKKIAFHMSALETIQIPNSVTKIGRSAFDNCKKLIEVVLPDSITEIDEYTFSGCSNMRRISIPNSVTKIGAYAFANCRILEQITIPASITEISEGAFYSAFENKYCLQIPNGVTKIGVNAFYNCGNFESINIPESVTEIGYNAFHDCCPLQSLEIPDNVSFQYSGLYLVIDDKRYRVLNSKEVAIFSNVNSTKTPKTVTFDGKQYNIITLFQPLPK